jgi:hypothetical protein
MSVSERKISRSNLSYEKVLSVAVYTVAGDWRINDNPFLWSRDVGRLLGPLVRNSKAL